MRLPPLTFAALVLLGFVVGLVWIPALVPPFPDVAAAGALEGYSNPVAYRVAATWTVLALMLAAFVVRKPDLGGIGSGGHQHAPRSSAETPWWSRPVLMALVAGVLAFLAYLPPAMARTGTFGEDSLMMSVLHRMQGGQVPYLDFEFLYGPLLIYPAHAWMEATGFSLVSYYTYYSLTQALGWSLLVWVLLSAWSRRPGRGWLWILVLAPFFLDTLAGVNWYGLRRLAPVLLLVAAARDSDRLSRLVGLGLGAGVLLAYSHDYAVGALLALAALFGVRILVERSWEPVWKGALVGGLAVVTWWAITMALLGPDVHARYLELTRELIERFSRGEAGFRFYWTLAALAVFGLWSLATVQIGSRLRSLPRWELAEGDRMLLMAFAYGFILLKSGLNRADFFHLNPPFLALALTVALPLRFETLRPSSRSRVAAGFCVAITAFCTLLANLPGGSHLARGQVAGAVAMLQGTPRGVAEETRFRVESVLPELLEVDGSEEALATYLAHPDRADRPVYFYGRLYALDKALGVRKLQYMTDDFMYSDERGMQERAFVAEHPDALVLITEGQWGRLLDPSRTDWAEEYAGFLRPTVTKRLIDVLSSVHFRGVPPELEAREKRWARTVGEGLLQDGFAPVARFEDLVVLARPASASAAGG